MASAKENTISLEVLLKTLPNLGEEINYIAGKNFANPDRPNVSEGKGGLYPVTPSPLAMTPINKQSNNDFQRGNVR